jgi:hypothetical protein
MMLMPCPNCGFIGQTDELEYPRCKTPRFTERFLQRDRIAKRGELYAFWFLCCGLLIGGIAVVLGIADLFLSRGDPSTIWIILAGILCILGSWIAYTMLSIRTETLRTLGRIEDTLHDGLKIRKKHKVHLDGQIMTADQSDWTAHSRKGNDCSPLPDQRFQAQQQYTLAHPAREGLQHTIAKWLRKGE